MPPEMPLQIAGALPNSLRLIEVFALGFLSETQEHCPASASRTYMGYDGWRHPC